MPKVLDWHDSLIALGVAALGAAVLLYSGLYLYPAILSPNYSWIFNWSGHLWFLAIPLIWHLGLRRHFPIGKVNASMIRRWLVAWIILLAISVPADIFGSQHTSLAGIGSLAIIMSLLFNVILVGVSEEFLFRGQIQTGLNNSFKRTMKVGRANIRIGTILATIAFAAFHLTNVFSLPFALVLGILVGHFYDRTDNLWGAIVIHNAVDFLGTLVPILLL